ncbi:hypothetical protein HALLA_16565 [Halostagnicola larsenii XH-48]|uniref:CheW-like domain-containing protein n=1 Tax=Halostagnicola larsenii XH-48 TaxID=797299 RepID=W0JUS0_9EURY|nr:chemotaxis protein CheW [Halostagnicola larsenii]AHG01102.1 hypothetical protein HALLA_16565 [Halostagnicola larsenii XH-48]
MSEDEPDPDDEFEDQLSDVGSRTREKFSADEQKKAEKLGVSPSGSSDPSFDTEAETTEADGGTTADDEKGGADGDEGSAVVDESPADIDTGSAGADDAAADDAAVDDAGVTDASVESAETDGTDHDQPERTQPSATGAEPTGSESGTVYEYNDMNTNLEHEPEPSVNDQQTATESSLEADTDQSGGAVAGFGGVATGERMAVTKTEVDFVTGEEGKANETEQTKLLFFELNDELFAAPLESISSVEELSGLTRYPRSPEPIDGVTDMRGKIIAVLNPKVIVDLSNASHENGAGGDYIIVQEEIEDEHRIGVRVDDISHVESASEDSITPIYDITEMDLVTIDESYLQGIIHGYRADEQAQVPLVDFTALMETLKEY